MRRAIIHIGIGKTGSTTIQAALAANRAALLNQGFAYPVCPGRRNHLKLAILAADPRGAEQMIRATRQATPASVANRQFTDELATELGTLPSSVHTVVFSNEHLATKVATADSAARLRAVLDRHFNHYTILPYLRRQDEYAVSLYTTLLRSGSSEANILAPLRGAGQHSRLDFAAMLDRWGAVFGRPALAPRLFARDAFVGGDLLADFRAACGGFDLPDAPPTETRNPSNLPVAQELLRRLNIAARGSGEPDPAAAVEEGDAGGEFGKVPNAVRGFLDSHYAGSGRRPARADAMAFAAGFDAGNERVRAEFFPDRDTLFSTDFSRYPDVADPPPPEAEVLDVALALVLAQRDSSDEATADTAFRRGRARQAAGDLEEARRLHHRALGKWPAHVGALRALLELADTPDLRQEAAGRVRRGLEAAPGQPELRSLLTRLQRGEAGDPPAAKPKPGPKPPAKVKPRAQAAPAPVPTKPPKAEKPPQPAQPTAEAREAARKQRTPEERAARRAALTAEERAERQARRAARDSGPG